MAPLGEPYDRSFETLLLCLDPPAHPRKKMSDVVYYALVGADLELPPELETRPTCRLTKEGTVVAQRVGSVPKRAVLMLIRIASSTYVLELRTKAEEIYPGFSYDQYNTAKTAARRSDDAPIPPRDRVYKVVVALAKRLGLPPSKRLYSLPFWCRLISNLRQKTKAPRKQAEQRGRKNTRTALERNIERQIRQLRSKQQAVGQLAQRGITASISAVQYKPLEDDLVAYFLATQNTEIYTEFEHVHSAALARYVKSGIPPAKPSRAAAASIVAERIDSLEALVQLVDNTNQHLSQNNASVRDVLVAHVCGPTFALVSLLGTFAPRLPHVKNRLLATGLNVYYGNNCIMNRCKTMTNALQMCLATRTTPNVYHGTIVKPQTGVLKCIINALEHNHRATGLVKIRILMARVLKHQRLNEAWKAFMRDAVTKLHASYAGKTPPEILQRVSGFIGDVSGGKYCKTDVNQWVKPDTREKMVRDLQWLWLWAQLLVGGFDNTFESFVHIYLESAIGKDLVMCFVGWFAELSESLKSALQKNPGTFAPPKICANVRARSTKTLVYGPPVRVCIDALWEACVHQWPKPPEDRADAIACARFVQFIFFWALTQKYQIRPHMCDEVSVVTQAQFDALQPERWSGQELTHGLWVIYKQSGDTLDYIKIAINDSKVNRTNASGQRNQANYKKYVEPFQHRTEYCQSGGWTSENRWLKRMWPYVMLVNATLAPVRFCTDRGANNSCIERPIYTWPTPMSPVATKKCLRVLEPKGTFDDVMEWARDAVGSVSTGALEFTQSKVQARRNEGIEVVREPGFVSGNVANTGPWCERQLNQFMSQWLSAGTLAMDPKDWRLDVDATTRQRKRKRDVALNTPKLETLKGRPRLLGNGTFTDADLASLRAMVNVRVEYKGSRHCELSTEFLANDVLMKIHSDQTLLDAFKAVIQSRLDRELHGEHVGRQNYNKKNTGLELCSPDHWASAPARLKAHPTPPKFDDNGITQWPTTLVTPAKTLNAKESVWTRASINFSHLTLKEQTESLHFFAGMRKLVVFLQTCGICPVPTPLAAFLRQMQ